MDIGERGYAAVFIDFENIYYYLKQRFLDLERTQDCVIEIIRELRKRVATEYRSECIVLHAYADFERVEVNAQGPLYLIGVETHNVLSTDHKNAADMRLCIDALETLYVRKEIDTFIFVAGDRDYIPVIQHLKKHAKSVLAVAFTGNVSGDLVANVGPENLLDAASLLSLIHRNELIIREKALIENRSRLVKTPIETLATREVRAKDTAARREAVRKPDSEFNKERRLETYDERLALEVLLANYSEKKEIWVTPYLHKLRQELVSLADYERKGILTSLVDHGAVAVEMRKGEPHDYSVIILNWHHPDVIELNPGIA